MFLRKLLVMFVPLLLAGLLCVALPRRLHLGLSLALLLPLSGASKRREPFAGLLLFPALTLLALVVVQYLEYRGIAVPVLGVFRTSQPVVVLVECAFAAYMLTAVIRTKK